MMHGSRWDRIGRKGTVARDLGRVVKVMGDGVLVEFGSAVDAVECAIALQTGVSLANNGVPENRRILLLLRIGINLGNVIVEGGDLYGDGVNIVTRLEAIAEPGSVCISASVHDQVRVKVVAGFEALGTVFSIRQVAPAAKPLALPATPSIAIYPSQAGPTQHPAASSLRGLPTRAAPAHGQRHAAACIEKPSGERSSGRIWRGVTWS